MPDCNHSRQRLLELTDQMVRVIPEAGAPRDRRIARSRLAFSLPLIGYWLLAILMGVHPQPAWVLVILGSPLVLVAFAITGHVNGRAR